MGNNIEIGSLAPNFALIDTNDKEIRLSGFIGKKKVLLALIRGFA